MKNKIAESLYIKNRKLSKRFIYCIVSVLLILIMNFQSTAIAQAKTITALSLNRDFIVLDVNDSFTLKVTNTKSDITWKSNRTDRVTVNKKGKIVAKGLGYAVITAKANGLKVYCDVLVTNPNITLTFDSRGGSQVNPVSMNLNDTNTLSEIPTTTKPGAIFLGWYVYDFIDYPDFGSKNPPVYDEIQVEEETEFVTSITVYARWGSGCFLYYEPEDLDAAINKAKEIIGNIITPDMTDYDKIKAVHDYMVNNVSYDSSDGNCFDAYGALVEGKAVCQGYTDAFWMFMSLLNIDCKVIDNDVESIQYNHTWNLVKLDGEWYHLDTTWDDPLMNVNGTSTSDFKSGENLRYKYFLISDSKIASYNDEIHVFDTTLYPQCTSTLYDNYSN